MEMQDVANLILNNGAAVVLIAYFIYRDLKFMTSLNTTLTTLVDTVDTLKDAILSVGTKNVNV